MKKMSVGKRLMAALPVKLALRIQYFLRMGKLLSLRNPQTFNEKVQFRKAFDQNPLLSVCSDKVRAKHYVADRVGPEFIIPTYWTGAVLPPPSERNWPRPFVLKANHMSGSNIFIRPDDVVDWNAIEATVSGWMKARYRPDLFERHYDKIERMLLVEPLMGSDFLSNDYKFMVFNGRVEFVAIYTGRGKDLRTLIFNRYWEPLGCRYYCDQPDDVPEEPYCFQQMIEIAKSWGADFVLCASIYISMAVSRCSVK